MRLKGIALTLVLCGSAFAGGYKIPEQSIRSTATSGAYFSSANHADSSYYNPANMAFMKDTWFSEVGIRYIVLPSVKFEGQAFDRADNLQVSVSEGSRRDQFFVPYFHYVSPKVGNFTFGLSFTTPAGLSKGWESGVPKGYAQEFLLEVYELSLSASYKVSDRLAVGGGIRGVYARGEVQYSRDPGYSNSMEGDSNLKPGFFLSVSAKPIKGLTLSTLYRSKVDLEIDGDASGYLVRSAGGQRQLYTFSTRGNVKVPLPAEWRLGASYDWEKFTLEFTYERTFWSSYERLNFNFRDPVVENTFGNPVPKDWKDTNTYRVGLYYRWKETLTLMGGIAYDETPVPERTLGFELPDSDGWIISTGALFKPEPNVEIGVAYLAFLKEDRKVDDPQNVYRINGDFKNISAHMLTVSLGFRF